MSMQDSGSVSEIDEAETTQLRTSPQTNTSAYVRWESIVVRSTPAVAPDLAGEARSNRLLLLFSTLAMIFAALVSNGFYHYDEHFMILEFAGIKLGMSPTSGLTWEFAEQMRSWMQPALYYCVGKPLVLAGLDNPFLLATVFRLVSGAIFMLGIALLMRGLPHLIDRVDERRAAAKVLALSWFIPVLAVRTSSESLSAAMMCLALGSILAAFDHPTGRRGRVWFIAAGLAQGFAFEFRFQSAFMILGLFAWLFWVKRVGWADFFLMAFASTLPLGLGLLVDTWGYGRFTVSAFNYFNQNLLQGQAAQFGVSPIWEYFVLAATNFMAPFTIVMTLALLVMWWRRPFHVLTWLTLPFVLGHMLVGHKEWRFLFPIAVFASLALVLAVTPVGERNPSLLARIWQTRRAPWFKWILVANCAAMVLSPIMIVRTQLVAQAHLFHHLPPDATLLVVGSTPYSGVNLPMHFYRRADVQHVHVAEADLAQKIKEVRGPLFVVFDDAQKAKDAMKRHDAALFYDSLPAWAPYVNLFNWTSRTTIWRVLKVAQPGEPS